MCEFVFCTAPARSAKVTAVTKLCTHRLREVALPYLAIASSSASTQKLASSVFDNRQDNTLRVAQSKNLDDHEPSAEILGIYEMATQNSDE